MFTFWMCVNLAIFINDTRFFVNHPASIWSFLRFCYSLIIGLGIVFVVTMEQTVGYKFRLYDIDVMEIYFLSGYACMWLSYYFSYAFFRSFSEINSKLISMRNPTTTTITATTKYSLRWMMILSILASLGYLLKTGISFNSSGYESRYNDAAGSGIFLIFIPAFLPWAAFKLIDANSAYKYIKTSIIILSYGLSTFILLHGYRQLLIASIMLVVVIGVKRQYIHRGLIVLGLFSFPIIIIGLSFIRYASEASTPFSDQFLASLYYIQGDVFPVDAPLRTYWFCSNPSNECPGIEVFFDHLTKFMPRAIFPNKPLIALDAAGFYTQVIVNYTRQLTLSSTILSEAFMMGSKFGFCLVFAISGILAAVLQYFIDRKSQNTLLFFALTSNVYMGFFWVREGLEDAINRIIIISIYLAVGGILGKIQNDILKKSAIRR